MNRPSRRAASAGLLLFRRSAGLELFLAHPGGPFWARRDRGAWTLPKGEIDDGEDPLAAARREFTEETGVHAVPPFLPLGGVRQKAGKIVHAWAWEGDADPERVTSVMTEIRVPRSDARMLVPEIDRCAWFSAAEARDRLNPAQVAFIDRLEALIADGEPAGGGSARE